MYKIPLIKPYLPSGTKDKVSAVLDSGFLTEGPVTAELEALAKAYISCKHVIAVSSCTTGLELALRAVNIGSGDEVIVPDYTYPATLDAVAIAGAKSVVVDISTDTMLIDYEQLEKAIKPGITKAIMPVSEFGNPLDYDILNSLKKKYGIFIIEDAACALGSSYKGKKTGTLADISVFSMHPRKFITSGEGGLISTDNTEWYEKMRHYKKFGMASQVSATGSCFDGIGSNYKISDILSAVALEQFKQIDMLLEKRLALAEEYRKLLAEDASVRLPVTSQGGIHSYQTFIVFIEQRDAVMQEMRKKGIEVQIGTYAMHMQDAFRKHELFNLQQDYPGSDYAFKHALALPLYYEMTGQEQKLVVSELRTTMQSLKK